MALAQSWTTWTTANGVAAQGTITMGSSQIQVTYTGEMTNTTQLNGVGTNYYLPTTIFTGGGAITPPPGGNMIAIVGNPSIHTITFSAPVINPVMAIVSLGQATIPVSYNFNAPFIILNQGSEIPWGGGPSNLATVAGSSLRGVEGDGIIVFPGVFSSISWTVTNGEYWNGFTVGTLQPNLVATTSSGTYDKTPVGAFPIDAHFPLGATIELTLEDGAGNPIPSSYDLTGPPNVNGAGSPSLFQSFVVGQYRECPVGVLVSNCEFQAVHLGSVPLVITPNPSTGYGATSVNVIVEDPAGLGSGHHEVDPLILQLANKTGIPPQFIKAQIAQETNVNSLSCNPFSPTCYRYEPLTIDFARVSRKSDYRATSDKFVPFRFATAPDDTDETCDENGTNCVGLTQGTRTSQRDLGTRDYFENCIDIQYVTVSCILLNYNSTQNWRTRKSGKAAKNANLTLSQGSDDFTAQTSLSASFGLLQVTFKLAVQDPDLNWPNNPADLFDIDPDTEQLQSASLNLGTTYIEKIVSKRTDFQNHFSVFKPSDLPLFFYKAWLTYNGAVSYPGKVAARINNYLPVAQRRIF
jgi:hypothetical protein